MYEYMVAFICVFLYIGCCVRGFGVGTPRIPANYLMRTGLLRRSFQAPETCTALHKYHSNEHPLFAPVLRCRQSTMPPHRLFPPPCPDTNIEYSLLQYLCKAVLVITRERPRDSLGLLSPLRCSAGCAATLIHRIFRIR